MSDWNRRSPLAGLPAVSTAERGSAPAVRLVEEEPGGTVLVAAWRGQSSAAGEAVQRVLGMVAPSKPYCVMGHGLEIVWSGPGRWLVFGTTADGARRIIELATALAGLAACTDQSDAHVKLRLSGTGARRALMKLAGVDVHDQVFRAGDVAMTPIAHMPVHLWRRLDRDGAPEFVIAGARSTAVSLWDAIVAAASELGLDARPLQPALAK